MNVSNSLIILVLFLSFLPLIIIAFKIIVVWIKSLFQEQIQKATIRITKNGVDIIEMEITFVVKYNSPPISPYEAGEFAEFIISQPEVPEEEAKLN